MEVIYTDRDGTYQLLLSYLADRFQPMTEYYEELEEGVEFNNKPSRLYINYVDSGINAKEPFLRKADSVTAEFVLGNDSPEPWQCTAPQAYDFAP